MVTSRKHEDPYASATWYCRLDILNRHHPRAKELECLRDDAHTRRGYFRLLVRQAFQQSANHHVWCIHLSNVSVSGKRRTSIRRRATMEFLGRPELGHPATRSPVLSSPTRTSRGTRRIDVHGCGCYQTRGGEATVVCTGIMRYCADLRCIGYELHSGYARAIITSYADYPDAPTWGREPSKF